MKRTYLIALFGETTKCRYLIALLELRNADIWKHCRKIIRNADVWWHCWKELRNADVWWHCWKEIWKKGTVHLEGLYAVDSLHRWPVRRAEFLEIRCVKFSVSLSTLWHENRYEKSNRNYFWVGGGWWWKVRVLSLHSSVDGKGTTEYENRRGNAPTMTWTRRYRWASPFSGRLLKQILRQMDSFGSE